MEICETRQKILLAAKKEFANQGYDGARMSSISITAGVNQALLHYHYKTKENLYIKVFETFIGNSKDKILNEAAEEIKTWLCPPDLELYANLYLKLKSCLFVIDDEINMLISKGILDGSSAIKKITSDYFMPHFRRFRSIIDKGIQARIFETSNIDLLVLNIFIFASEVKKIENIIEDDDLKKNISTDPENIIFNHMIETTFKSLCPAEGTLDIPELTGEQEKFLDEILLKLKEEITTCI